MLSPFSLFLLLALVGAMAVMGYFAAVDCRDAELLELSGVVRGKTVGTKEVEKPVVIGGCPLCPGSKPQTKLATVSEEVYYLLVEVEGPGGKQVQRFVVDEEVYRKVEPGTPVEVRYLRGKVRGTTCTPPQLVILGG